MRAFSCIHANSRSSGRAHPTLAWHTWLCYPVTCHCSGAHLGSTNQQEGFYFPWARRNYRLLRLIEGIKLQWNNCYIARDHNGKLNPQTNSTSVSQEAWMRGFILVSLNWICLRSSGNHKEGRKFYFRYLPQRNKLWEWFELLSIDFSFRKIFFCFLSREPPERRLVKAAYLSNHAVIVVIVIISINAV